MNYKIDEKLYELINNKTIAYVGPSPHLIGQNTGKKIDSYDLVCRVGQDFPLPENRMIDYGSRSDILLSSCNEQALQMMGPHVDSEYFKNLKYVVCPGKNKDFQKINKHNIPFHVVGAEYHDFMNKELGCDVTTGLGGIITLLNYEPKELYITGITFYGMWQTGATFEQMHYPEYTEQNAKCYDNLKDCRIGYEFGHFQPPQIDFFASLLKKFNNISLDDYLKRHFQ